MKMVNPTELGVAVTPMTPDWNSLHQASSHCSWEPAAQRILLTEWLREGSRAARSLRHGAGTELFPQRFQSMPITHLSSARPVQTLTMDKWTVCAFLLRKVAANRASKSLISGLASRTPGLPGQRGRWGGSVGVSGNCGRRAWNALGSRPQGQWEPSAGSRMLGWSMRIVF